MTQLVGRSRERARAALPSASAAPAVAGPAVLMFVLACWGLGRPSMYGTEAVTYWAAHLPVPTLLHVLTHVDAVHGLYYLFMHGVFELGGGTVALRLPSAFAMTATVVVVGLLAQRLTGSRRVAFFASAWMCTVPFVDGYAQQGRSYAMDILAASVTALLLLRAIEPDAGPARRRWIAYAIGLAVAGYLHEMTTVAIIAHGVTLWWARTDREQFRRWLRAVAAAGIALLPLLVVSALQGRQLEWVRPASWQTVWELLLDFLGPSPVVLAVNTALVVVAVVTGRRRRTRPGEVTLVGFAMPLLVLPPLVVIAESAVTQPYYGGARYFLYSIVGGALLVGAGLDRVVGVVRGRGARPLACVGGAAVLIALLAAQWPLQQRVHSVRGVPQDMLAAAVYLQQHARPGDAVVYAPRSAAAAQLVYPRDFAAVHDVTRAQSPERSGTLYGTQKPAAVIRRDILDESRIWLVGKALPSGTARPELATLGRFFRVVSRHQVHGVLLVLYERRAPA